MVNKLLIPESIKDYLAYDPETGLFWWVKRTGSRCNMTEPAGSTHKLGYINISFMGREYKAHRVAYILMDECVPHEVDHINGVKDDNRWCNLRSVTRLQNCYNRVLNKNNSTGYKGVTELRGKYTAQIGHSGKLHYLGLFETPLEAHEAYCKAANKYHGIYANMGY